MTTWVLLAPGPSMIQELADSVRGRRVGVVSNAFEFAPWAMFLAATDAAWWRTYPAALEFSGDKFSPNLINGVKQVRGGLMTASINSGTLALECAKREGATRILLLGFDMHGSHFFGAYTNGLKNTSQQRRRGHLSQYTAWARINKKIEVLNCTEGSALKCFPMARMDDYLPDAGRPILRSDSEGLRQEAGSAAVLEARAGGCR